MSFLTGLFGGDGDNLWITAGIALALVIVLIVLAVWLLKLLFGATSRAARGRNRRLGIIDTLPLDQKRHLMLIRRDGVEHLLLIGGAQDVAIETGIEPPDAIARTARPAVAPAPEPQRASEQQAKPAPAADPVRVRTEPVRPETPSVAPGNGPAPRTEPTPEKPREEKRGPSLRYTGLLRPVTRMEPELVPMPEEKSPAAGADSDKNAEGTAAASSEEPRVDTPQIDRDEFGDNRGGDTQEDTRQEDIRKDS